MTRYIGITHRVKRTAAGAPRPTIAVIMGESDTRRLELKDEQAEFDFLETIEEGDVLAMTLGGSGDYFALAINRTAESVGATLLRIPPFHLSEKRSGEKDDDAALLARLVKDELQLFYAMGERDRNLVLVREALRARIEAMKARIGCEQRLRSAAIGRIFCTADGPYPEGGIEKYYDAQKASDPILVEILKEEKAREQELTRSCENLDVYNRLFVPITGCGPMIASRIISAIIDIRRFGPKDPELVAELAEREAKHTEAGSFVEHLQRMTGGAERPARGGRDRYEQLERVRSWLREQRLHDDANELTHAINAHRERSALRRAGGAKLKAFCGVHVLPDGTFPRRRSGDVANWNPVARQALYLLGDQFNRRPQSDWGKKLRENKVRLRDRHPVKLSVMSGGTDVFRQIERTFARIGAFVDPAEFDLRTKTGIQEYLAAFFSETDSDERLAVSEVLTDIETKLEKLPEKTSKAVSVYSDGHIHKMALWKTLGQFVEKLYHDWWRLEIEGLIEPRHQQAAA